ncbi:hydrophobin-like protein [Whalleya microplaca]|nr:hydrophobin-like protein [Whalleya microplaca]
MQFQILILSTLAVFATASPASDPNRKTGTLRPRPLPLGNLCPSVDSPLCCQTDVDGLIDLTCESPSEDPHSLKELEAICAKTGLTAQCCTLPLLGDALLCTAV